MEMETEDLREKIVEALENKSDEEVEEEFSDLIRNRLTNKQFWEFISTWEDGDDLCERMEEWDIGIKRREIKLIKKMFKIK